MSSGLSKMPGLQIRHEHAVSNEFMWTQSSKWSSKQEHFLIVWFWKPLKELLNYDTVTQLNLQVAPVPFLRIWWLFPVCSSLSFYLLTTTFSSYTYSRRKQRTKMSFCFPHIWAQGLITNCSLTCFVTLTHAPGKWNTFWPYTFPAIWSMSWSPKIHASTMTFTNVLLKTWILDKFSWSVWNIAQSMLMSWQGHRCEDFCILPQDSIVILKLK